MSKARIFIVEDEALIAMELKDRLEHIGYDVCGTAVSGEDAVASIPEHLPDLVLMDIRLTGEMNGIDAASKIREMTDVPVVYLTAFADSDLLSQAAETGPLGYLVKPFDERELRATIEVALYKNRMESSLRESEHRYRMLFESAEEAIFILEAEAGNAGKIVDANKAAAEMHGYTVEELRGMNITDLDTPEAASEAGDLMGRMRRRKWIKKEIEHRRKDGSVFPVEISAGKIKLDGHRYILAFDRDITESKRSEALIRQQYGIQAVINSLLYYALAERTLTDIFQYALDQVLGVDWLSFESSGCIMLADNERKEISILAHKGMPTSFLELCMNVPFGKCLCGKVAETRQLIFVENVSAEHEIVHPEAGPHGHYCVPIQAGDEFIGVLSVHVIEGYKRKEIDELFLQTVADVLAGVFTRKRIEREKAHLAAILEATTDFVAIANTNGNILYYNRAAKAMLGLDENKSFNGIHIVDAHPQWMGDLIINEAIPAALQDGTWRGESVLPNQDGREIPVSQVVIAHRSKDGTVEYVSTIARDITEQKRMESDRESYIRELTTLMDRISRSHKEWQTTFDGIGDLISIHDRDCTIIKANKAFAAYLGMAPRDVVNRKCYELMHNSCEAIDGCPHVKSMKDARTHDEEIFDKRTGRTLKINTFPYYGDSSEQVGTIHIAKDVTDEREREKRLILSERLASLGQMGASIAHEINNPLAAIAGCTDGLLARIDKEKYDPRLFRDYLKIIQEEVFRCKTITSGMLSLVRTSGSRKIQININEVLDKSLETGFGERLGDVEIVKKYFDNVPLFEASEGELRQVFIILINNALEAMEDRGTLTLETSFDGKRTTIRVSDTGCGIPSDIANAVFNPFFSTKADRGGTGLGLAIANKIISDHGGYIDISSRPLQGTTFTVSFPV